MSENEGHPVYPPGLPIPAHMLDSLTTQSSLPPLDKSVPSNRTIIKTASSSNTKTPIVSCGVICLRKEDTGVNVLLIRRKDSLGYVEFIRGKYKPSDPHYVRELVDSMTHSERNRIVNTEFSELWKQMWISKSYRRHRPEYDKSYARFEEIKHNIREYIINHPENGWDDPEWGFPKGRPNRNETKTECALREFTEETGIPNEHVDIIDSPEYEEDYIGTNGIMYQNKYIIGTCGVDYVGIDPKNKHQLKEISDVAWINVKDAPKYIRNTYPSRLIILENSVEWFLEHYH